MNTDIRGNHEVAPTGALMALSAILNEHPCASVFIRGFIRLPSRD
jgi:hypothetical protein